MVKGTADVEKRGPGLQSVVTRLQKLTRKEVYVGIPQEKSSRDSGDHINNAELLYIQSHGVRRKQMIDEMKPNLDSGMKYSDAHALFIQEHGSPMWRIPPRPVLEPAIENRKESIGRQLAEASKHAMDGNPVKAEMSMEKAGMLAESAAKAWFEDPRNGWAPNSPKTIARKGSSIPLVDTNEMRKSITYVIRERK
jgi:hypothetical protein